MLSCRSFCSTLRESGGAGDAVCRPEVPSTAACGGSARWRKLHRYGLPRSPALCAPGTRCSEVCWMVCSKTLVIEVTDRLYDALGRALGKSLARMHSHQPERHVFHGFGLSTRVRALHLRPSKLIPSPHHYPFCPLRLACSWRREGLLRLGPLEQSACNPS